MLQSSTESLAKVEAKTWVTAKFAGKKVPRSIGTGIYVFENHDPVFLDKKHNGPIRIAGKEYPKGIYCHANSHLRVQLPSPGAKFSAIVGLDDNPDTAQGKGSVVFSVEANRRQLYKSDVKTKTSKPDSVEVDLGGATTFDLMIGDSGDGIGWDQSDWADAKVKLQNGKEIYVSDLPLNNSAPAGDWTTELPFSLKIGGKAYVPTSIDRTSTKIDANRTQWTLKSVDSASGLEVKCVGVAYNDFPFAEWTVYLRNNGSKDTPLITDFRGIDTTFDSLSTDKALLHHHTGSLCVQNDFEPFTSEIGDAPLKFSPGGGRPSQAVLPYFNVEGQGKGVMMAVGWPGEWSAAFSKSGSGARVIAGQETTSFVLKPSEEVRSPLIALGFYDGGWVDGQNTWRQWMIKHTVPQAKGKVLPPQIVACSSHLYNEMLNANEKNQIECIDGYLNNGLKLDYWWMDAGWYPNDGSWWSTGTWEVDKTRFPKGFVPISDHAHKKDVKIIVWFEPERILKGTWLFEKHSEWTLGDGDLRLLNMGNPEALKWVTEHISSLITDQKIDFYRQDYNIDPLGYWQAADAPDRQGITENKYVAGYLAYWDGLLARHPGMPIDTCASGGRRLDLETLRRSVPLLRSDYIFEPIGQQCHTYGLSFWVPYQGSGAVNTNDYEFRSVMLSSMNTCYDVRRKDLDYANARKLFTELRSISDCFMGDYYPLMPYTRSNDQWIAWQFNYKAEKRGFVQAFRRGDSNYESVRLKLQGLKASANYEVTGNGPKVTLKGSQLMKDGLVVTLMKQPEAAVIQYIEK